MELIVIVIEEGEIVEEYCCCCCINYVCFCCKIGWNEVDLFIKKRCKYRFEFSRFVGFYEFKLIINLNCGNIK